MTNVNLTSTEITDAGTRYLATLDSGEVIGRVLATSLSDATRLLQSVEFRNCYPGANIVTPAKTAMDLERDG